MPVKKRSSSKVPRKSSKTQVKRVRHFVLIKLEDEHIRRLLRLQWHTVDCCPPLFVEGNAPEVYRGNPKSKPKPKPKPNPNPKLMKKDPKKSSSFSDPLNGLEEESTTLTIESNASDVLKPPKIKRVKIRFLHKKTQKSKSKAKVNNKEIKEKKTPTKAIQKGRQK